MLSLKELQSSTINAVVAREAYTQVDRHLLDILDVRKSIEQKAATLMSAYITISLALFGLGATVFKDAGTATKVWPFFGAGLVFIVGAWCFITALKSGQYAAVGSTPEMWLNRGTIDGSDSAAAAMLAYITFHHSERIAICIEGNKQKIKWFDFGIYLGPIAPVVLLMLFFAF
jgi:hypothetical protein